MVSSPPRKSRTLVRLVAFASVPPLLILVGMTGYHVLEGWSWFDALYVSVITLTSMGYGERHAASTGGRVFTMVLALGGIFTLAVVATEILSTIITGEMRAFWGDLRMRKRIEALDRHVIVCGYGKVGQRVCANLQRGGARYVVIDRNDAAIAAARGMSAYALLGDATEDATLLQAGIGRARALVALAGTDADNLLITMTARELCPLLPIVAFVETDANAPKLRSAGATRTISPHAIVAGRVAQAVLQPNVLDFIEVATRNEFPDMQMEEQSVRPGSPLDGKTVGASGLRSQPGFILIGIKRPDGHLAVNPDNDASVAAGDTLIALSAARHAPRDDNATQAPRRSRWRTRRR